MGDTFEPAGPQLESLPAELQSFVDLIRETSSDLVQCGPSTYYLFNKTLASLPSAPELAASLAASLTGLANEQLLAFDYKDVPVYWRRLHTDATLLAAIALVLLDRVGATLVRSLDLALIVSGTPGEQRREITFALIARAQAPLARLPTSQTDAPARPTKRARVSPLTAPPTPHPIPRLSSPPFPVLPSHPFILPAHCAHWPASTLWSSPSHLLALAGPARVVPVEVGLDYTASDWGQRIIPLEDFILSLEEGKETLYLAQHDLFRQIPALRDDVEIPDLVYSAPDAPADAPEYKPVTNDEGYTLNAWLGPAGTVSPAHTDPYFNCFAQIIGSKWIWVAPPSATPSMTTFAADQCDDDAPAALLMGNTARVDVTKPLEELRGFPEFVRDVLPVAQQAVLEPGDLLFMPPGWWHAMKSLETSFSVSIWF